jgi:hypothetical protein
VLPSPAFPHVPLLIVWFSSTARIKVLRKNYK